MSNELRRKMHIYTNGYKTGCGYTLKEYLKVAGEVRRGKTIDAQIIINIAKTLWIK